MKETRHGEQCRAGRTARRLGAAPAATPLAGWFFLAWGPEISVRPLAAAERLARLGRRPGWHRRGVGDPALLLGLAGLPAWELGRPRDWRLVGQVVERVRDLTDG